MSRPRIDKQLSYYRDARDAETIIQLKSLKAIRCCANWRCIYNLYLGLNSNLTSIFNRSWDMTPSLYIHTPRLFKVELEKADKVSPEQAYQWREIYGGKDLLKR